MHVRWMIRKDTPTVLGIEEANFEFPWSEDEFIRCLRQRNCIGIVVEIADVIAGFMIYELHKGRLEILKFAVDPAFHRRGAGRAMVTKLTEKLTFNHRRELTLIVREGNLDGQLFLKAMGFRALTVYREYFEEPCEDGYYMRLHVSEIREPEMVGCDHVE